MSQLKIDYLGEGETDEAAARKLISFIGASPGRSYSKPNRAGGKANVDQRLRGLNAGSAYGNPVLILRDLDSDANCAPLLVESLVPERHKNFILRVCVRQIESWILADKNNYANYIGISASQIPRFLESEANLKKKILDWGSSGRAVKLHRFLVQQRSNGIPDWASFGRWQSNFVKDRWNISAATAIERAPSLNRCLSALRSHLAEMTA